MLWLGIHTSLPGILGHARQGDEQQSNPTDEEQDKGGAGTGEGPRVVVLYPDRIIAVNHPFDRLPHDFHGYDNAQAWREGRKEICKQLTNRVRCCDLNWFWA